MVDYTTVKELYSTTDRVVMYLLMTNDEADDRYSSVNIIENDLSHFAGVKLSTVITLQTEW